MRRWISRIRQVTPGSGEGLSNKPWLMPKNPRRLLILFSLLLLIFAGEQWYRYWRPDLTATTDHYIVYSTATQKQTREIADVVEVLYTAYGKVFTGLGDIGVDHSRLKLKLFKDRKEFRRCNRQLGWAEARYRKPYCYAYYSATETNPYHWMLHEAVHQLNREVAHLNPPRWADEGIAAYFSTSEVCEGTLLPGQIDSKTYLIWWLWDMSLSGNIDEDIQGTRIIPLRTIVSGKSGPDLDEYFNLYYIHWWSLTHFLFHYEQGKYRDGYLRVIEDGGALESFEKHIGPMERVQSEWYRHLQQQQQTLTTRPSLRRTQSREEQRNANKPKNGTVLSTE